MRDRVPTLPGRIKLTDENGVSKYYTMERADEPTDEGTPINKFTLLSDETSQYVFEDLQDHTVSEAIINNSKAVKEDLIPSVLSLKGVSNFLSILGKFCWDAKI